MDIGELGFSLQHQWRVFGRGDPQEENGFTILEDVTGEIIAEEMPEMPALLMVDLHNRLRAQSTRDTR